MRREAIEPAVKETVDALREDSRECARRLATGVAVLTTSDVEGRPVGLTMSAFTCLSLEPPLFLVCIGEESDTLPALLQRGAFALNLLRREQEDMARVFAGKGRSRKFDAVEHARGALLQVPVLQGVLAVVECQVVATYPGGDHRVVVGRVEAARASDGEPLLYYARAYRALGRDGVEHAFLQPRPCAGLQRERQ